MSFSVVSRFFTLRTWWIPIFLFSFGACITPHLVTRSPLALSHDAIHHQEYVLKLLSTHQLPKPLECWQCYQPPLYYSLCAVLSSALRLHEPTSILIFMKGLALVFYLGYLWFGLRAIRLMNWKPELELASMALFTFWPAGVIHSLRVGNDGLIYLLWGATVFYFLRWLSSEKNSRDLIRVSLLCVMGSFTKGTFAILVGSLALTLALPLARTWLKRNAFRPPTSREMKLWICGTIVCGLFWTTNNLRYPHFWPVANDQDLLLRNPRIRIENSFPHLFGFDVRDYLGVPYTSAWDNIGGRQYFWNYTLKTSIFGEFSTQRPDHQILNWIMCLILLGFSGLLAWSFLSLRNRLSESSSVFQGVTVVAGLAALFANRIVIPASCSGDFRYIFPIVLSAILMVGRALNDFSSHSMGTVFVKASCLSFVLSSVISWFTLLDFMH